MRPRLRSRLFHEAFDKPTVDWRVPVLGPDQPLNDDALTVEQEALGDSGRLVDLGDPVTAILEKVEIEAKLTAVGSHIVRAPLIDTHRSDLEPRWSERLVDLFHRRHFG